MALYRFPSKTSNQQNKVVKAVFFDRDGVLNPLVERLDGSFTAPWDINEFRFIDAANIAVDIVKKVGYNTYVVTNQPDVHDGYLTRSDLDIMNRMVTKWLGIDEVVCAFQRNTDYYKPNNGMIESLIEKYNIDRGQSYIIGDRWKDIVAGHKSKLSTIFIGEEYTFPIEYKHIQPDYIVNNVLHACTLIVELSKYD